MKNCIDCKGVVSNSAKRCPHCGAKLKMGFFAKIFIGFFLITIIGAIFGKNSSQTESEKLAKMSVEERKIFEENKLKQEKVFQQVALVLISIKESLRDPDSLVFENILADEDKGVVCVEYRARNGFGGMNREFVVSFENKIRKDISLWNKHCANKSLKDYKHASWALKYLK